MAGHTTRWKRAQEGARDRAKRGRRLLRLFFARPVGRALRRYLDSNGNVLAGGVAYYSLASVAAALVLAVSVASLIVVGNETFREAVFDFIGNAIPGLFPTDERPGIVDPETLSVPAMSGVVGLVAFGVLVYTATRYMRGLRAATRTMLGSASAKSIPGTLRDVIALLLLGVIALVATGLQVVASALAKTVAGLFDSSGVSEATVWITAAAAGLLADIAFVALVLLVLGSARAPARILVPTIGVTAVVIMILQQASGYFVRSASQSAVLAPFAAIIALMIFVDFTTRVLLISAAWVGAAAGGRWPGGFLHAPAARSWPTPPWVRDDAQGRGECHSRVGARRPSLLGAEPREGTTGGWSLLNVKRALHEGRCAFSSLRTDGAVRSLARACDTGVKDEAVCTSSGCSVGLNVLGSS